MVLVDDPAVLLLLFMLELTPFNPLNSEGAPFELLWTCILLIEGGNEDVFVLLGNPEAIIGDVPPEVPGSVFYSKLLLFTGFLIAPLFGLK